MIEKVKAFQKEHNISDEALKKFADKMGMPTEKIIEMIKKQAETEASKVKAMSPAEIKAALKKIEGTPIGKIIEDLY